MTRFDDDTRWETIAPGRLRGEVSARYNIGAVPNGGYVAALGLRSLTSALPDRAPLSVSTHFLKPARPGPVEARVEVVKQGKRFATALARLSQEGREHAIVLATFGVLDDRDPLRYVAGAPPELPPVEECHPLRPNDAIAISHVVETRVDPREGFLVGKPSGRAELAGWQRFRDGRAPDLDSLVLFADAMPPPMFNVRPTGWVPTLELTVHLRARPQPGWLRARFTSRFIFGGLMEEDGELWDERGTLVAQSRQLAQVPDV
jgi:acyl-CoA thioesterase